MYVELLIGVVAKALTFDNFATDVLARTSVINLLHPTKALAEIIEAFGNSNVSIALQEEKAPTPTVVQASNVVLVRFMQPRKA